VLARAIETAGLPTCSLVLLKEHAQRTKPPRALFVPFPYGYALGKPDDAESQHKVLRAALQLFGASAPVLAEFSEVVGGPVQLVQASAVAPVLDGTGSGRRFDRNARLLRMLGCGSRGSDGRRKFRHSAAAVSRTRSVPGSLCCADCPERPSDIPVPLFIRYVADDLKAFMLEARMQQRPEDYGNALHHWLWSETAIGRLLGRVAQRLKEDGAR